jgi:hypothetical protein
MSLRAAKSHRNRPAILGESPSIHPMVKVYGVFLIIAGIMAYAIHHCAH